MKSLFIFAILASLLLLTGCNLSLSLFYNHDVSSVTAEEAVRDDKKIDEETA